METFPASIESQLDEAGFSGSEVVILKSIIQNDAMTLREIAKKTGKSVGTLDQAMKKLLKRGIVTKILINEIPKYSIKSLQIILDWMEQDFSNKKELLVRKQQNFKTYMISLAAEKIRPEMEYFEGIEGIKKAYDILISDCSEMMHYLPARYKEEEDPLADFRKNYTKERKRRDIFSRIISEDSPLGRRYQSADYTNFRQTVLVSPDRYPFFIEQVIAGNRIAYIDHENLKACILLFSNLAKYDALFFEADWKAAFVHNESMNLVKASFVDSLPVKN